jgi:hypothetical protein
MIGLIRSNLHDLTNEDTAKKKFLEPGVGS